MKMFEHSQYPCHVDVLIATEKNKVISFFTFEVTETGCILIQSDMNVIFLLK